MSSSVPLQHPRRPCYTKCTSDINPLRPRRQFQRFFPPKSRQSSKRPEFPQRRAGDSSRRPAKPGQLGRLFAASCEHKRFALRDDARRARPGIRWRSLGLFQPRLALASRKPLGRTPVAAADWPAQEAGVGGPGGEGAARRPDWSVADGGARPSSCPWQARLAFKANLCEGERALSARAEVDSSLLPTATRTNSCARKHVQIPPSSWTQEEEFYNLFKLRLAPLLCEFEVGNPGINRTVDRLLKFVVRGGTWPDRQHKAEPSCITREPVVAQDSVQRRSGPRERSAALVDGFLAKASPGRRRVERGLGRRLERTLSCCFIKMNDCRWRIQIGAETREGTGGRRPLASLLQFSTSPFNTTTLSTSLLRFLHLSHFLHLITQSRTS
ncbi:hypothetical protein C7M84_011546 [Penaeus vannamei]|uniref:Uncharacterized protein n=1 Tax=Penaeus vannamei TaxID=6689 RepID=A0A3R7MUP7_PENVA|nr:hypothetical protein C7M84_011546 [Penaeus vannamei]